MMTQAQFYSFVRRGDVFGVRQVLLSAADSTTCVVVVDAPKFARRLAASHGRWRVLELLMADARTETSGGRNAGAMCAAVLAGSTRCVEVLLRDARTDPTTHNNGPIINACRRGHAGIVALLLADARVDPSTRMAKRLLYEASAIGHADVVATLLRDARIAVIPIAVDAVQAAIRGRHMGVAELLAPRLSWPLDARIIATFDACDMKNDTRLCHRWLDVLSTLAFAPVTRLPFERAMARRKRVIQRTCTWLVVSRRTCLDVVSALVAPFVTGRVVGDVVVDVVVVGSVPADTGQSLGGARGRRR
jgi:hypothetical protein